MTDKTVRPTFWDLSRQGAMVNVPTGSSPRERLIRVFEGGVASSVWQANREVGKQTLMIVRPSATAVQLTSAVQPNTVLVMLEPISVL